MNPYAANLKTLYQCGPLWFWHIVGGVFCIFLTIGLASEGRTDEVIMLGTILVPLWVGVIVSSVAKDITVKPFAFGLPRHSAIVRRLLLVGGVAVGAICALLFHAGAGSVLTALWSTFAVALAAYLAGVLVMVSLRNANVLLAMGPLVVFVTVQVEIFARFRSATVQGISGHPLENSIVAGLFVVVVWKLLDGRRLARKFCGESFLAPFHALSVGKMGAFDRESKVRKLKKKPGRFTLSLERFFLARMAKRPNQAGGRYLWGTLYNIAGGVIPADVTKIFWVSLVIVVGMAVLGYYRGERLTDVPMSSLILFVACLVLAGQRIASFDRMLLPVSRKNRFRSLVLAALVYTATAALLGTLIVASSFTLDRLAHEITLEGKTYTYIPVVPNALLFFLLVIPFFYMCQLLFPKHYIIPSILVAIIAQIVFIKAAPGIVGAATWVMIVWNVVCWLPFLALAYYYCYKRDVVLVAK